MQQQNMKVTPIGAEIILPNHSGDGTYLKKVDADKWEGHDLPTLANGKYLTNNGTALSWGTVSGGTTTTTDETGTHSFNTVYQNTTGKPLYLSITLSIEAGAVALMIGSTSSPSTYVDRCSLVDNDQGLHGIIPVGWYYELWISDVAEENSWITQTLG